MCVENSEAEAVSWRITAVSSMLEYRRGAVEVEKKSACEDFTCDLKTLCALQYSDIGSM
jgi:hypothetical protein